jgi:disulfide bond formation protein DsbB
MLVKSNSANPVSALVPIFAGLAPGAAAALLVGAGGLATILGAYFFQYVLGYQPCPLCLEQRIPYYVAIPLAFVLGVAALRKATPRQLMLGGLAVLTLIMLVSAVLGAYHAGVEWKLWAGPADCTGSGARLGSTADMLRRMNSEIVVQCDVAAWRFLGISLAGYNVLISLALAAVAGWGVAMEWTRVR